MTQRKGMEGNDRRPKIDPIGRGGMLGLGYLAAGVVTALLVHLLPPLSAIHATEDLLPFVGIVVLWPFLLLFHLSVLFGDAAEYTHKGWLLLWLVPIVAFMLFALRAHKRG